MQKEELPNAESQIPPGQIETGGLNTAPPAFDFNADAEYAEADAIAKELQDIEASLENNFAKHMAEMIDNDPALEELFFNDKELFIKKVISEQNEFVTRLAEPLNARLTELQGVIRDKTELGKLEALKQDFLNRHPDVNLQELLMFFANELPAKIQEEIKNAPIEEFFNLIYELYLQQNQPPAEPPPPPEPGLPNQMQGVAIPNDLADYGGRDLPIGRD